MPPLRFVMIFYIRIDCGRVYFDKHVRFTTRLPHHQPSATFNKFKSATTTIPTTLWIVVILILPVEFGVFFPSQNNLHAHGHLNEGHAGSSFIGRGTAHQQPAFRINWASWAIDSNCNIIWNLWKPKFTSKIAAMLAQNYYRELCLYLGIFLLCSLQS